MTSSLNAASAVLVIGRWSLPVHALLYPDHPALLGTMLSCRLLGRCSLQRKCFSSDGWLQLLRCSCRLSALLVRLVSVIDHSGRAMAQHNRHKLMARIMQRYFSAVTAPSHTGCGACSVSKLRRRSTSSPPLTERTRTARLRPGPFLMLLTRSIPVTLRFHICKPVVF
jgi:hypothetical protein